MRELVFVGLAVMLMGLGMFVRYRLRRPSRHYEGPASVSDVYDHWTQERILEYYWGDHLHAGYYGNPPVRKDFITAKVDMIDEMVKWGIAEAVPALMERLESVGEPTLVERIKILDVGCGIGGSTRHLAKRWRGTAHVTGITISKAQVKRATLLAKEQNAGNTTFLECDALNLGFADNSFDIVWAVESEPHMPDKEIFVREMVRVLKPGGILVIAAWNVRDTRGAPLSRAEAAHVKLLVDEWSHASFIAIHEYVEYFKKHGLVEVKADDWSAATQPTWKHAVTVALRDPRGMIQAMPYQIWRLVRDAHTILRYDAAFRTGLCQYGLLRGRKPD